jgi:hypothetical protein
MSKAILKMCEDTKKKIPIIAKRPFFTSALCVCVFVHTNVTSYLKILKNTTRTRYLNLLTYLTFIYFRIPSFPFVYPTFVGGLSIYKRLNKNKKCYA